MPELSENKETAMINRDLAMRLVERSPQKIRAAAVLYYIDGLEQDQVASTLGISRRTVINRLQEFVERSKKFVTRQSPEVRS